MRNWLLALLGMFALAGAAQAAGERFLHSAWLCASPEAYAEAVAASADKAGAALDGLRACLLADNKCTYLPERNFSRVITAVRILETRDDLLRVRPYHA